MKALLACGVIILSASATNTLGTRRVIEPVGVSTSRKECQIVQCLDSARFINECKAAVASGCTFSETVIIDGEVSGDDLCVAQLQPASLSRDPSLLAEQDTILLPKLDLSLPMADPTDQSALTYVSGEMYFETALANEGSSIYLRAFPSSSTACDTTYDQQATALSLGPWKKGETKIDFGKKYPKSFDESIINGSNMAFFNSTIDIKQAEKFVGFYSNDYTLSMTHEFTGNAISYKTGTQTLTDASGTCVADSTCTDKDTLEGLYDCILKGPEECELTATYTITDTVTPARGYCATSDNMTHVLSYTLIPEDAYVTQSSGEVSLNTGSTPAEICNVEVKGSPSIDIAVGDCGLDTVGSLTTITTTQIGPDNKSIVLGSIPDGVQTFVVTSDKDWSYCGGGLASLSTDNLSAKILYNKYIESTTTSTTQPPAETVVEDPFDTPASSGVMALLSGVSILPLLLAC